MRSGNGRGDLMMFVVPALLVIAAVFWFAFQFVQPAPPKSIVISTGAEGGAYDKFGRSYAALLQRSGITLEARASKGSVENLARIKDPGSGVALAMMQGGIVDPADAEGLVSLGRVFLEPLWVFHRLPERVGRLAELAGKRLAIGSVGSGTRKLALSMLAANGLTEANAQLLPLAGQPAADALHKGEVDAIFLSFAPEAPLVQALLRDASVRLMSFDQGDAYARLFPYLQRIVLPRGVVDLAANIPAEDVTLLAPQAAVVAREDMHPALVALMVDAIQSVHSGGNLFYRAGEFPKTADPELRMSDDALRTYKSGQPVLRRYLPFWLAVFLERMMVMLLPIVTVAVPLIKFVPQIYQWRIKRRIYYWYGQLKRLERRVNADRLREHANEHREEVERIEQAVAQIPVPDRFAEQLYDLRGAVDFVRQRIVARAAEGATTPQPASAQVAPAALAPLPAGMAPAATHIRG